jgi:hypothetical protein
MKSPTPAIDLITEPMDSKLYISLSDKSIIYYYKFSHENLCIREDIPLIKSTKENLISIKMDMIQRYTIAVELYYQQLCKTHLEKSIPDISKYFGYLIGSSPDERT